MAETRSSRYSPPFTMNNLGKMSTFASPTSLALDLKKSDPFVPTSNGVNPLPGLQVSPTLEKRNNNLRKLEPSRPRSKVTVQIQCMPLQYDINMIRTMLSLAKDLDDVKLVNSPDARFQCAVAYFHSEDGAIQVRDRLNGKPNGTKDSSIVVEILPDPSAQYGSRRNTVDGTASRQQSGSGASSSSSNNGLSRQTSRYSHNFQKDKISPPLGSPTATSKEFPIPDSSNRLQSLFSPQSPVANSYGDYHRNSGKAVINDDGADDETGELLKDPLGYAQNDYRPTPRFNNNPVPQFGSLSLNTSFVNGNSRHQSAESAYTSPRAIQSPGMQSPAAIPSAGSASVHSVPPPRLHYPPANPADQHPPCNTLYVGNLPVSTEEDELKQIFSKQRGFKRLMYRVKQQGPMCFVEFEDISLATRALNDLYGTPLHNSTRGGIRLSFSRNPLGVRSGQPGPHTPMNPHAMAAGYGNGVGVPPGFTTTNKPPPGLPGPGLRSPANYSAPPLQDNSSRGYGAPRYGGMNSPAHHQTNNGGYPNDFNSMNGGFPNYNHGGYSNNYSVNGRYTHGISSNGDFTRTS